MEYWPFNEPLIINLLRGNDCLESTIFLKKTMGNSIQSLKMPLSPNVDRSVILEVEEYGLKASINDLHNAGNLDAHDRDTPTD
jgi:hypothetical protein